MNEVVLTPTATQKVEWQHADEPCCRCCKSELMSSGSTAEMHSSEIEVLFLCEYTNIGKRTPVSPEASASVVLSRAQFDKYH